MTDHVAVCADRLMALESMREVQSGGFGWPSEKGATSQEGASSEAAGEAWVVGEFSFSDEEAGEIVECRICHEEELVRKMEAPCGCRGSLKFTHRKCVQRWCNEKKSTTCEICYQPYQTGYTAPSPHIPCSEDTVIDISERLTYTGSIGDVRPPMLLGAAEHLLEAEYGECATPYGTRIVIMRTMVLILLAFLLMREAFSVVDEENTDISYVLSLLLLRALSFLLPMYIVTLLASLLLHRHQRHETGGLATSEVADVLPFMTAWCDLQFTPASV